MDQLQEYVYIFKPGRDKFWASLTSEERAVMDRHDKYCQEMVSEGTYVLSELSLNGAYGICVFKAESPEAALQVFGNDPAIKAGLVHAELHLGVTGLREEKTLLKCLQAK
jgi:hypothetical protein